MVAFTTTADLYQAFLYMENRRVTRATEAVSPTVTDRHSHSASFTNMAHSYSGSVRFSLGYTLNGHTDMLAYQ